MCWPCLPRIHGYVLTLHLCVSVMAATMDFLTWYPLSESTLHRYEVHPYGTLPVGPGPEFKTTLRVRSWRGAAWHEEGGGEESWEDRKSLLDFSGIRGKGEQMRQGLLFPASSRFPSSSQVQNLGCYVVSGLIISAFLPAVAHGGSYFLSLSQVITTNVSLG